MKIKYFQRGLFIIFRNGQLQGGGFSGHGLVMASPEMSLLELPFLFDNYDEVEYVYSKLRPRISKWFKKRGYHLILLGEQDFDQIYSTKIPIKTPDDFKNSRVLTWYGPLEEKSFKAMGASPLPIRVPEISASIRTGVCDVLITPAIWAVGTQMYTVMKYINPVHIRYCPFLLDQISLYSYIIKDGVNFDVKEGSIDNPNVRISFSLESMSKMLDMKNVDMLIGMQRQLTRQKLEVLSGLKGTSVFQITNADGTISEITATFNDTQNPKALLRLSLENANLINSGKESPINLYMSGKMKIDGDIAFAMKLQPLFTA